MDFSWLNDAISVHPFVGAIILGLVCALSATLLPIPSEAMLFAYLKFFPNFTYLAWFAATFGNTLGGMIGFFMGMALKKFLQKQRANPHKKSTTGPRMQAFLRSVRGIVAKGRAPIRKYGQWSLLLSWLPIIGDALCVAAGYFQFPWLQSALYMAIGKGLRYAALLGLGRILF